MLSPAMIHAQVPRDRQTRPSLLSYVSTALGSAGSTLPALRCSATLLSFRARPGAPRCVCQQPCHTRATRATRANPAPQGDLTAGTVSADTWDVLQAAFVAER